jgi:outer membrane protein TolC
MMMKRMSTLALAVLMASGGTAIGDDKVSTDYQVAIKATDDSRMDYEKFKERLLQRYADRVEQMRQAESGYVSVVADSGGRDGEPLPANHTFVVMDGISSQRLLRTGDGRLPENWAPWWQAEIDGQVNAKVAGMNTDITSLFTRALNHSSQIKVFGDLPLIRETTIQEAQGPFDYTIFAEGRLTDLNEPVGDDLKTGGPLRYEESSKNLEYGIRKKFITGTDIQLSQNVGDLDTNSVYFNPKDQARTGTALTIRQPLLKAFGIDYNETQINLANIDSLVAQDELRRQVESHLLEISRAYWALYMERSLMAQKSRLCVKTLEIFDKMKQRAHLDVPPSLLARAKSQVHGHELAAMQAEYAVLNAQSRIRALVNDPEMFKATGLEMVTTQLPVTALYTIPYDTVLQTALNNRPEVAQSLRHIQSAALRLDQSRNELLPSLDLFFQVYVKGLDGDYQYGQAYDNQFNEGDPSYIGGLRLEYLLGSNGPQARNLRKKIEIRQLLRQLDTTVENVLLEAEVSYRELVKNYRSMVQSYQIMQADGEEMRELLDRVDYLLAQGEPYGDMLYRVMDASERLAESEERYAKNELTYNYSTYNLHRAMGILVADNKIAFVKEEGEDELPQTKFTSEIKKQ